MFRNDFSSIFGSRLILCIDLHGLCLDSDDDEDDFDVLLWNELNVVYSILVCQKSPLSSLALQNVLDRFWRHFHLLSDFHVLMKEKLSFLSRAF